MADEFIAKARLDISNFTQGIQNMEAQLAELQQRFAAVGSTGAAEQIGKVMDTQRQAFKASTDALDALIRRYGTLQEIQQRLGAKKSIAITPAEQEALGGLGGQKQRLAASTVENQLAKTGLAIETQRAEVALAHKNAIREEAALLRDGQRIFSSVLRDQVNSVISGERENQILRQRLAYLAEQQRRLAEQKAIVESQVATELTSRPARRLESQRDSLRDRHTQASEKQLQIIRQIEAAEEALRNASTDKQREKAKARLNSLLERQRQLTERIAALEQQLRHRPGAPEAALGQAAIESGAVAELERIKAESDEFARQEQDLLVEGLDALVPRYKDLRSEATALQAELNLGVQSEERKAEILKRQAEIVQEIAQIEKDFRTSGIREAEDPEIFRQRQFANLTGLERTFAAAFDDIGRRFTATLQFAISGALIFGVQQFVREFAEAAIDVERTFADISSALEFDLADEGIERGSAAFDRRIEDFRRNVIDLANEFNVLPEVANKAAFQMTARFSDSATALKAVRAQLLATKVSTIDQSEALRALTATAEGFAAAVLESNDALTFQERLLERERVAAEGYAAALDEAVYIQQRFGIEVEDTLEGTARAAETFRQLGFTRQETEATVAAVAFQLGQTGTNVAERLNRAFAGITQPEVRDALLELAAASEAFKLSISDFDSGAGAIKKIDDQIRRLQEVEPGTALGIRDILGQRRETEVVAAFFGTADLRKAIETSLVGAAGAAERRFGFIEATVSEQIQSILVKFQEMAQLFERIGGLSPFKLALAGAETFLDTVNSILKAVQGVFEWFDRIGEAFDVRIGEGLTKILSVVLAISVGLKALSAAATAFRIASATQASVQAAQAAALAGGGIAQVGQAAVAGLAGARAAKTASLLGSLGVGFAAVGAAIKNTPGLFARLGVAVMGLASGIRLALAGMVGGFANFLRNLPGWQSVFRRASDAVALWTSRVFFAAGAVLTAISLIESSTQKGRDAGTASATAVEQARTATRRQERLEGFETPAEEEVFFLGEVVKNLTLEAQENARSGIETALVRTFPFVDEALREELGGWGPALGQSIRNLAGGDVPAEVVRGSTQWWEDLIADAERAFLQAQINAIRQAATREFGPSELPTFDEFDLGKPLAGSPAALSQRQLLERDLLAAQRLRDEATTPEERVAAQAQIDSARERLEDLRASVKDWEEAWEGSLSGIQTALSNITSGVQAGRIDVRAAPGLILAQIENLEKQREELERSENLQDKPQQLAENQAAMDAAIQQYGESVVAAFEQRESAIELIRDPVRQLEARLAILREQYRQLGLAINTELGRQLARDIAATQNELADAIGEAAVAAAEQKVALARTTEEWVKAMQELNRALDVSALVRFANAIASIDLTNIFELMKLPGLVRNLMEELAGNDFDQTQNDQEVADRLLDEAQRRAAAAVRLANPIRNRIAQINSEIAATNVLLASGTLFGVELMEAQIRMQELLADRVEAQQNAVAAYIRLQAGNNDRIKNLQAEITIGAQELEFTANAYGELSEQYSQLALQQDRLKYELVQATLALEDVQRRLKSDITNNFEQAQLDLIAVLAELANAGDLGELERAQLELKKAQAEAAAEKAFFDDRLFQLRFAFETGALSLAGYKAALQRLLESVDTSTQQGKETFLQIQSLIEGLTNDISDMSFNIPAEIRLPTLFEVRRALAADQMGVNYMDNRQVEVNVAVTSVADLEQVLRAIDDAFGDGATYQFSRTAPGGATIYSGGF